MAGTLFGQEHQEAYQDHPGVIVKPPLIVLGFLAAGFFMDSFGWTTPLYEPAQYLGGGGLAVAGFSLMAGSIRALRQAGTPVETWRPTAAVVSRGPYAHMRNPIYSALLLVYLAIGMVANAPAVVALAPLLFAALHFGVVLREEHYLEFKFGDAYLEYRRTVPRWL